MSFQPRQQVNRNTEDDLPPPLDSLKYPPLPQIQQVGASGLVDDVVARLMTDKRVRLFRMSKRMPDQRDLSVIEEIERADPHFYFLGLRPLAFKIGMQFVDGATDNLHRRNQEIGQIVVVGFRVEKRAPVLRRRNR